MIPDGIEPDHVLEAMKRIDRDGIPQNRESTKYYVRHNKRKYPPKYLLYVACRVATLRDLDSSEFTGGKETNSFFTRLGFTVVDKRGNVV